MCIVVVCVITLNLEQQVNQPKTVIFCYIPFFTHAWCYYYCQSTPTPQQHFIATKYHDTIRCDLSTVQFSQKSVRTTVGKRFEKKKAKLHRKTHIIHTRGMKQSGPICIHFTGSYYSSNNSWKKYKNYSVSEVASITGIV